MNSKNVSSFPDLQVCVNMSMCDTSASEPKGEEDAGETISNLLITSDYNCKSLKNSEKAWQMSFYTQI